MLSRGCAAATRPKKRTRSKTMDRLITANGNNERGLSEAPLTVMQNTNSINHNGSNTNYAINNNYNADFELRCPAAAATDESSAVAAAQQNGFLNNATSIISYDNLSDSGIERTTVSTAFY